MPELAVEALDVCVLGRPARLNQDALNAPCLHPRHGGPRGELWTVARLMAWEHQKCTARLRILVTYEPGIDKSTAISTH